MDNSTKKTTFGVLATAASMVLCFRAKRAAVIALGGGLLAGVVLGAFAYYDYERRKPLVALDPSKPIGKVTPNPDTFISDPPQSGSNDQQPSAPPPPTQITTPAPPQTAPPPSAPVVTATPNPPPAPPAEATTNSRADTAGCGDTARSAGASGLAGGFDTGPHRPGRSCNRRAAATPPVPPTAVRVPGGGLKCSYRDGASSWDFTVFPDKTTGALPFTECPIIPFGRAPVNPAGQFTRRPIRHSGEIPIPPGSLRCRVRHRNASLSRTRTIPAARRPSFRERIYAAAWQSGLAAAARRDAAAPAEHRPASLPTVPLAGRPPMNAPKMRRL